MSSTELCCYRCGAELAALTLPLGRRDECPKCRAELHVCRMCVNFDRRRPKGCREDDAEEVRNKESANFCDYFKPSDTAFDPAGRDAAAAAKAALDDLFK